MEVLMVPEREIGPLERSIRDEHPDGGPLVELAARLALIMDTGDGSAAVAKELRAVLAELGSRRRRFTSGIARRSLLDDD
jgi:hypothetical protein